MNPTPESVERHADIQLNEPVLIAAFRGWNDAGDAATFATSHLSRVWGGERIASIDPEEFYDFQAVRPNVHLVDGITREITWPANEFWAARTADRDVLLFIGTEPSLRWKTFSKMIVSEARRHGVNFVVTLGALLADVPHSRDTPITGTAADPALVERLGLTRSGYEGPTGIVGVLHDAFGRERVESASLWAAVPHYLAVTPNPKASLALVRQASELIGVPAPVEDLERATSTYEERVSEIVAADEDVQAYVTALEERADEIDTSELPSGEALAAELENFLRQRNQGDGA
jgi:predicted ATP-grasp superfamily ATP-dependent carboligase